MKPAPLTGRVTLTEEECCRRFPRCVCHYEVLRADRCVASCMTREAFEAARRLLGEARL
jgi:hypothetical protein